MNASSGLPSSSVSGVTGWKASMDDRIGYCSQSTFDVNPIGCLIVCPEDFHVSLSSDMINNNNNNNNKLGKCRCADNRFAGPWCNEKVCFDVGSRQLFCQLQNVVRPCPDELLDTNRAVGSFPECECLNGGWRYLDVCVCPSRDVIGVLCENRRSIAAAGVDTTDSSIMAINRHDPSVADGVFAVVLAIAVIVPIVGVASAWSCLRKRQRSSLTYGLNNNAFLGQNSLQQAPMVVSSQVSGRGTFADHWQHQQHQPLLNPNYRPAYATTSSAAHSPIHSRNFTADESTVSVQRNDTTTQPVVYNERHSSPPPCYSP